jgi:hypothetical protein
MTSKQTCVADAEARVVLPTGFANATLIVEQLSDVEVRIRKKDAIEGDETEFAEERMTTLSDRDRDRFLQLLEDPPEPNAALRKAMAEHPERHG